jgi:small subunit ribosomal protein S1
MADAEHLNADADGMDDEQESIEQDSAEQVDTNTEPSSEEPIAEALPAEAPTSEDTTAAPSSDLEIFEKYIEEDLDFDLPSRGDLREGTIVEIRPSELLVNVGSKRDGVVPSSDLQRLDKKYVDSLKVGQTVDVVVSRQPDDDGIFLLSMSEALQRRDWQLAEELLESGEVTEHEVEGFNKGGLTVQFHHLRGFVPASHVVDMPRNLSEDQRREELQSRIGRTLRLKVIEVERRRRRLVMSQSLAEREFQAQRRKELFETIHVGDVIQGEVRSMRPFGAFVDIGGADGLLHVSEIDWRPVNHPRDVLDVGEMVEVQVIRVDPENHRIALSRKRRLPNPWDTVEERYHPGAIVPAKITRVVDFGAFAQLEPGVEGLIHISELADIAVAEPLKTVQVGDEVYCKILRVDSNRQRIGLSIRQVLDSERAELEAAEGELEDEELEAAEEAEEELEDEESDAMEAEAVAEALEEVSDEDASESADELSAEMNQDSSELAVEAEQAEEADGDKQTSE